MFPPLLLPHPGRPLRRRLCRRPGRVPELLARVDQNADQLWIDSICYHAMCGESQYQLGQYPQCALDHFDKALQLYLTFNGLADSGPVFMESPSHGPRSAPVPVGSAAASLRIGDTFPIRPSSGKDASDQTAVVQRGGVVQQALDFPHHPHSSFPFFTFWPFASAADLLGPAAQYDNLNNQVIWPS